MKTGNLQKKVFTALLLIIGCRLSAQKIITGNVVDKNTKERIIGATVMVPSSGINVITNQNGRFKIIINDTSTVLQIRHVAYITKTVKTNSIKTLIIELESKMLNESIVVEGTRVFEDDPATQKTIRTKELKNNYYGQDGPFLLQSISPSIVSFSESGTAISNYGQFRLRGIDQTRVNITLDGVPLNDMLDQGVYFSNFVDFGGSIESIQIQRGVGSSSNGTASYAGAVSFESTNIKKKHFKVETDLLLGSFNTNKYSLRIYSGMIKNKFAFYTRFSGINSHGFKYHSNTNSSSFFFSGGYFGKKSIIKITGFSGNSKNNMAYFPVSIDDINNDPKTNYNFEQDVDDYTQQLIYINHSKGLSDNARINSTIYYGKTKGSYPFGYFNQNNDFEQINYYLNNQRIGIKSKFKLDLNNVEISSGIHGYLFNRINKESISTAVTAYYSDKSRKVEGSAFLKSKYSYKKFSLNIDLQLRAVEINLIPDEIKTKIPKRNWLFFNPKFGFNYEFNDALSSYLSFGRTGREPTRTDILASSSIVNANLEFVMNKKSIKEERLNDIELGIKWKNERHNIHSNLFIMNFENEIASIGEYVPELFGSLRKNINKSMRYGIELDWRYSLSKNFSLGGFATIMNGKISNLILDKDYYSNKKQILTPSFTFQPFIQFVSNEFMIKLDMIHMSESYLELTNNPNYTLPSFTIFNTNFSYQPKKWITMRLIVNNVFNSRYYTYGSAIDTNFDGSNDSAGYIVQPPLNYLLNFLLKF